MKIVPPLQTVHGWVFPACDEFMAGEMHADGSYQRSHLDRALTYVTAFDTACDGGAHVGTWSVPLSRQFEHVIAVEPSPDTYEALCCNLVTFRCPNVESKAVALGAADGTVSMILDGRGAVLKNTGSRYVRPTGPVPLVTIDSWNLPALGFLKLDVEGSELAALLGARQTLTRCRPIVLFENKGFWTRYGCARDAPQTFLTSIGYRQLEKVGCDVIWGPA